jgi:hypothetical protein
MRRHRARQPEGLASKSAEVVVAPKGLGASRTDSADQTDPEIPASLLSSSYVPSGHSRILLQGARKCLPSRIASKP